MQPIARSQEIPEDDNLLLTVLRMVHASLQHDGPNVGRASDLQI